MLFASKQHHTEPARDFTYSLESVKLSLCCKSTVTPPIETGFLSELKNVPYELAIADCMINVLNTHYLRLSFLATMIYASVIYHRHRHGLPYHLRDIRAKEAEEERRKNSPGNTFGDTEAGITADANSLATTGRSTNGAIEAQAAQELGNNVEIMELDTEHKNPFQGRQRGTISINKKPRELQGDKAEVELSSQKSPKSSRKGSDKREKLAELEGDARWPDSQSKL